ncbi:MAG: winged helix-turn-helix transcriptional regulator, partial [Bosea sp.]|nr:winged helix-turn-helix transcriptional regulator [Bosea sp. (in: a-proteobacteria)]
MAMPPTLHEALIAQLRTLLLNGELADGSRIPEAKLCERFGVSRTPLREALKVMAAEGFVT